jgi:oligopeptide transport system permease protein
LGRYVLRRLLWMPLVLLVLVTVSFFLIRAAPGGPFSAERNVPEAVEKNLEAKYGMNDPAVVQYGRYVAGLVQGDFGPSFKFKDRDVNRILADGLPATLTLGCVAIVLALAIGLTAGTIGAVRQNSFFDYASMSVATFGMSIPTFVIGPLLVLVFALAWKAFPVSGFDVGIAWTPVLVAAGLLLAWRVAEWVRLGPGRIRAGREIGAAWLGALVLATTAAVSMLVANPTLVLPAVTLALPYASRIARLMRAGMLEVVNQDYIRTARAKGLAESAVVVRHAIKGGILPVVSYLGPAISGVLVGSLVVEKIFNIPGIGRELVEAAFSRDYFLVLGIVVLDGVLLVLLNLIVDVAYGFLDPRIRYD